MHLYLLQFISNKITEMNANTMFEISLSTHNSNFNLLFITRTVDWNSNIYFTLIFIITGAGLNLSNSKPTACINDFLPPDLRIRQEDYIANTLNKFQCRLLFVIEILLNIFFFSDIILSNMRAKY